MRTTACLLLALLTMTNIAHCDWNLHVAADASAGGKGSQKQPFRSLTEARDAIRAARDSGAIPTDSPVVVHIGAGTYPLDQSFELTKADSGTAESPVVYRAVQSGAAQLHGGIQLKPGDFRSVTDGEMVKRLDPSARELVRVCDLKNFPGEFQAFSDAFRGVSTGPWLYINGQPMELARWPNKDAANGGWAGFSKVIDTGLPQPDAKNESLRKPHPGSFQFENTRPSKWNIDQGVWLRGYWTHDWFDEVIRVASYDHSTKAIRLAKPHNYGIMGGTWGKAERRFHAINVFEELDAPGEWYLDRSQKKLYVYPPADFQSANIDLAVLASPMVKMSDTQYVTLEGLTLQFSFSDAMVLRNAEHVTIKNCTVANHARSGISIVGSHNEVRSCHLHNLGTSGISVNGGDRRTLTPANNRIVNNHIHDYAKFIRTYQPGVSVQGCGQIVRNNLIHDAPHNAVTYGGNEHLIERNEVHHVVMETGDSGAFYTGRDWTSRGNVLRHNYIHDLGGGDDKHINTMGIYLDDCDCGDTIEGNVFYRAGRAIMIGGGRDNPVINNLIIDCPIGLHMDARGMTWKQWNNPDYPSWRLEAKAEKFDYQHPPWSNRYPHLAKIMQDSPREPLYNPIRRNIFVDVSKQVCSFDGNVKKLLDQFEISDNLVVNTTGASEGIATAAGIQGFTNLGGVGIPFPAGFKNATRQDFQLQSDSNILKELPTFERIPMDQIGLQPDH
ncbi:hypothetical protein RISK_001854 [Rhodopirellula islandica]|uniref:Right handed beta helix domain-containing protein n=1 Tax=Rhodopirellula islandica TaxID=595434 RepID=A0A0J1BHN0_RHOIS|nr:right-handed parallel beta-helix repeat-containing protein [Rhodopirellula islandica]KLU06003.1 hypothetical protein RISK_001854 [Rhodopirellula islandica]